MLVAGICCENCQGLVSDNPEIKTCPNCGASYPQTILDLIKIHQQAKMKLVQQNLNPGNAVLMLAESSITAANLYRD